MVKGAQILKDRHIRVTPQRVAVYKILREAQRHLTAEEIHQRLQRRIPAVSLATVYSIAELLKANKLISEIRIKFDKSCFEARTEGHHHFLCRRCGEIFDVDIPPCTTLQSMRVDGHSIEKLHGYFYGECKNCRKEK